MYIVHQMGSPSREQVCSILRPFCFSRLPGLSVYCVILGGISGESVVVQSHVEDEQNQKAVHGEEKRGAPSTFAHHPSANEQGRLRRHWIMPS